VILLLLVRPARLGRKVCCWPWHGRGAVVICSAATALTSGAVGWELRVAVCVGRCSVAVASACSISLPSARAAPRSPSQVQSLAGHAAAALGALDDSPELQACCALSSGQGQLPDQAPRSSPSSTRRPRCRSGRSVQLGPSSSRMHSVPPRRACAGHRRCGDGWQGQWKFTFCGLRRLRSRWGDRDRKDVFGAGIAGCRSQGGQAGG